MNFFSIFLFAFFGSAIAINIEEQVKSLDEWWYHFKDLRDQTERNHPLYQQLIHFNNKLGCVHRKINLLSNGEIKISFFEALMLMFGPLISCNQTFFIDDWNAVANHFIALFKESILVEEIDCYKTVLQTVNPSSRLVENFSGALSSQYCGNVIDSNKYVKIIQNIQSKICNFAIFSCNTMTDDDVKNILLQISILCHYPTSVEELNALIHGLREKFIKLYDCVYSKFLNYQLLKTRTQSSSNCIYKFGNNKTIPSVDTKSEFSGSLKLTTVQPIKSRRSNRDDNGNDIQVLQWRNVMFNPQRNFNALTETSGVNVHASSAKYWYTGVMDLISTNNDENSFEINKKTQTMESWWNEVTSMHDRVDSRHPLINQIKEFNSKKWCVTTKVVDWNNKNKVANFAEAMVLIYGSVVTCYEPLTDNSFNTVVKYISDNYNAHIPSSDIDCFKVELQKFRPYLNDVKGFKTPPNSQMCENVLDMEGFNKNLQNVESAFGSIADFSCNVFSAEKVKELLMRVAILSGSPKDLTVLLNSKILIDELKDKTSDLFNCVYSRFMSLSGSTSTTGRPEVYDNPTTPRIYLTTSTGYQNNPYWNQVNQFNNMPYWQPQGNLNPCGKK